MQEFKLDLTARGIAPRLLAKQGDVGRKFRAVITDNGEAYDIPVDALLSVWYSGTSGEGNYSMIGENSAFSIDGNTVTVELITQMLTNHGSGNVCLVMNRQDGTQIGTWNIPYIVEQLPGMGSPAAEQYFTALSEVAGKAAESAAKAAEAAATFETDTSLSVAGKAADAAAVSRSSTPYNYLDNSDFRNPVNQRNFESLSNDSSGVTYVADRWIWWNVNGGTHNVTLTKGVGLIIGSKSATTRLFQKLDPDTFDSTKTYTAYCKCSDGTLVKGGVDNTTWGGSTYSALFDVPAGKTVIWAVVYEGEYTAETLPEYKPKGYGVELAECQRYFQMFKAGQAVAEAFAYNSTNGNSQISTPVTMRIRPSVSYSGLMLTDSLRALVVAGLSVTNNSANCVSVAVTVASGLTAQKHETLVCSDTGYLRLSAEL